MIKAYLRLGRPINALAGCIGVLLSAYVAGPERWLPVVMAALTVFIITMATNAWNDYLDLEIDKINQPQRPIPSGQVSCRGALVFSLAGTGLSLVTAAFINLPAFLIALAANGLLYIYSWRLKCTVLAGNATVATITATCFIFGGVAAGSVQPVIMLAVVVFVANFSREILKTMADLEGDKKQNCRTVTTAWGIRTARVFFNSMYALALILMPLLFWTQPYHFSYLLIVFLLIYPLSAWIMLKANQTDEAARLGKASLVMKLGFFVWFIAVALGAGLIR